MDFDAEIVAVTTDNLSAFTDNVNSSIDYEVVYSSGDNTIPNLYDAFDKFGDNLASSSTLIIDKEGKIAWKRDGTFLHDYISAGSIISEFNKLNEKS